MRKHVLLRIIVIAVGAAVGANLRYGLTLWAAGRWGSGFPYGTMLINVLGSLLIGIVLGIVASRPSFGEFWRLLIVTGLLGGFTTFSSYSYEAYQLLTRGSVELAALYAFGSVALGLCAVALGVALVRLLV